MELNRRKFIGNTVIGIGGLYLFPSQLLAADPCSVQHPFMPPRKEMAGVCHNCGMTRPMWARTFHFYEVDGEKKEVCSLHCLAESTMNSGKKPEKVKVALYHEPTKIVPVTSAFYVVGSKARGTMTMKSKLAFESKEKAEQFAAQCGGTIVDFKQALAIAKTSVTKENAKIAQNRLKKGKIVEPVATDVCPVCNMYPARYPKNKCQIKTDSKEVVHFCSTQCLFEYLNNPMAYSKKKVMPMMVWVIDYGTGSWIYGKNAFYVIGSSEQGPMGKEAIPFMNKEAAEKFAATHKGRVLPFAGVSIGKIMA